MPIGRCCELLDVMFERTKHSARLWCHKTNEERPHRYLLMQFYISNTLAYASPQQTEMLRKVSWTKAAHADLRFHSEWFEKVQHGRDCACIVADVNSADPTTCGVDTNSSPPIALMDCILHRLEKIDMPRDHGRVGIGRHTTSHLDLTLRTTSHSSRVVKEKVFPHRDRFYLAESSGISIGNFCGGQLWTESKHGHVQAPSSAAKGKLTVTRHAWTRLDVANVLHAVMPVTKGTRYSMPIYSPKHLHPLRNENWALLSTCGYPIANLRLTYQPNHGNVRGASEVPVHNMADSDSDAGQGPADKEKNRQQNELCGHV
eukprot:774204-Amphidinium_carterae.3